MPLPPTIRALDLTGPYATTGPTAQPGAFFAQKFRDQAGVYKSVGGLLRKLNDGNGCTEPFFCLPSDLGIAADPTYGLWIVIDSYDGLSQILTVRTSDAVQAKGLGATFAPSKITFNLFDATFNQGNEGSGTDPGGRHWYWPYAGSLFGAVASGTTTLTNGVGCLLHVAASNCITNSLPSVRVTATIYTRDGLSQLGQTYIELDSQFTGLGGTTPNSDYIGALAPTGVSLCAGVNGGADTQISAMAMTGGTSALTVGNPTIVAVSTAGATIHVPISGGTVPYLWTASGGVNPLNAQIGGGSEIQILGAGSGDRAVPIGTDDIWYVAVQVTDSTPVTPQVVASVAIPVVRDLAGLKFNFAGDSLTEGAFSTNRAGGAYDGARIVHDSASPALTTDPVSGFLRGVYRRLGRRKLAAYNFAVGGASIGWFYATSPTGALPPTAANVYGPLYPGIDFTGKSLNQGISSILAADPTHVADYWFLIYGANEFGLGIPSFATKMGRLRDDILAMTPTARVVISWDGLRTNQAAAGYTEPYLMGLGGTAFQALADNITTWVYDPTAFGKSQASFTTLAAGGGLLSGKKWDDGLHRTDEGYGDYGDFLADWFCRTFYPTASWVALGHIRNGGEL